MEPVIIAMAVAAVMIVLLVIHDRLQAWMQPQRLRLAELGERLIDDPRLTLDELEQIDLMLETAYNPWVLPLLALTGPISFCRALIKPDVVAAEMASQRRTPPATQAAIDKVEHLYWKSVALANPLAALLVLIEVLLAAFVLMILGRDAQALPRVLAGWGRRDPPSEG